ncbi:MAG: 3-isopropylmalate dehydrogenase [Xanthomonadales bacterium]|nr:3-isopropylmalate dehydrogenase [Xanthomonadales bacterium]
MNRRPFVRLTAPLLHLPEPDLDTDQIIPARFLTTTARAGLGRHAFHDRRYDAEGRPRPEFPLNALARHGLGFLLAGRNFGCGSSREHAVWALLEAGVRAVITPAAADIFRANALRNGLLVIELPPEPIARLARHAGREITVDLLERLILAPGRGADPLRHRSLRAPPAARGASTSSSCCARCCRRSSATSGSGPMAELRIAYLPGDGIGPEVLEAARRVLEAAARRHGVRLRLDERPIGAAGIAACGRALPEATLAACRDADAVLLGAVGDPRYDDPERGERPESGLLALRAALGLHANLRPVRAHPALAAASPLRAERLAGADLLIVRELGSGIYFGRREEGAEEASDECRYRRHEIERVARLAGRLARARRGRVTQVDKANVLATSRLWRRTVTAVFAAEFPELELEHLLVDAMAMRLLLEPRRFDVILTENLFGDVLSDEAALLAGSIGLLPSASLGEPGPGLFEPVHGSAPDLAGRDRANPLGAILSAALLLRHAAGLEGPARAIELAVERVLAEGPLTPDLGGSAGTAAVAEAVRLALAELPAAA